MAGCSIVVLTIIMMPLLLVCAVALVAIKFVTSPAFIFLVASGVFCVLALVDAVRILWVHSKNTTGEKLSLASFRRPLWLLLVAGVLFIVMMVLAGSMIMAWCAEVAASRFALPL